MKTTANLIPCLLPEGSTIRPVRVLSTKGYVNIRDPASFTITNDHQSYSEIILDYGKAEGGYPIFGLSAEQCQNYQIMLRVVYSETRVGIDNQQGDGPFFLFSNAMDTYRSVEHSLSLSPETTYFEARFAQSSQRYQKLILTSPNCSVRFCSVGLRPLRMALPLRCQFSCSDDLLNRVWEQGVRTVDMCTVERDQTRPAWDFTQDGARVHGQHWAPCRQGTRWRDIEICFDVRVEECGASWGIHMVANGLIFCLDQQSRTLKAFEGLADQSSVFPTTEHGSWSLDSEIQVDEWISVVCTTEEDKVRLKLNGTTVATLDGLDIHPLLGGAPNNSGSVAFGGPVGWTATYRNLHVQTLDGEALYSNTLLPSEAARTMLDFAVGSNPLSCTIDGAKRDRSTFGGDLFVMGQSVAYSTSNIDAIKGSIQLLTSHQTKDGFLGNLCPIQAPMHTEEEEPPTYAFYSLEYALLLVVAIKDYWFTSGDVHIVRKLWPKLIKLMDFVGSFESEQALIAAPPPLSLTFFPLAGPVFGPAAHVNLAYYDALLAMTTMAEAASADPSTYLVKAETLKASILTNLWSSKTGHLSIGASYLTTSHSQQSHAYSILLGVSPPHASDAALLLQPDTSLPLSFLSAPQFSHQPLVSPFSTAFAIEAAFKRSLGSGALSLLKRVWGPMADASDPDFSGCHWEAMNGEGRPIHDSTSLVHGWSTAPVYLLPKYLAGVRVVEPGWKRWAVEPVEAGVKHVEARLETVAGRLGARIDWDECGTKGGIEVEVPDGTVAEVIAPVGWFVVAGPSERSERKEAFTGPGTFVVSVRREAKTVATPVLEAAGLLEADTDGRTLVAQT